jgi:hypothetical protein
MTPNYLLTLCIILLVICVIASILIKFKINQKIKEIGVLRKEKRSVELQSQKPKSHLMDPLFEKLVYLRNNLELGKLHEFDPMLEELIPIFETHLEEFQQLRIKSSESKTFPEGDLKIIELMQFICINILDFLVTFQSYFKGSTKWEKNLHCRQLALLIYEFTDDIHNTINETIRKNKEIDKVDSNLKSKINDVVKKLAFIKQLKYDDHLKELRNQTIAHKEEDIHKLFDKIQNVDEKLIIACSMFLVYWIRDFFVLLKELPKKLEALHT